MEPDVNGDLHRLSTEGAWKSTGAGSFAVGANALGRPLPAGWYRLRGRLDTQEGSVTLPSVRLHYVRHSALTEAELMLPDPGESGSIDTLLLLFEDVELLEFTPGITPARFAMRGFTLSRMTRAAALRTMICVNPRGIIARSLEWARKCVSRGLRRATDDLYADYCRLLHARGTSEYELWVRKYDTLDPDARKKFGRRACEVGDRGPLISVLLRVDGTAEPSLRRCLDALLEQAWQRWELCVIDASHDAPVADVLAEYAARDARIRAVSDEGGGSPNAALGIARGEFVALLEAGIDLRPHALLHIVEAAVVDHEIAIIYSDEDRIDGKGARFDHDFKPDWNPDLLLGRNYLGSFVAIRAVLAREAGGFRDGHEDDCGYDLLLRCSEPVAAARIHHVPAVLYHRRAEEGSGTVRVHQTKLRGEVDAGAVAEHLRRIGSDARVETIENSPGLRRVRWPLPQPAPKVSLVVPTRDRVNLLRTCVESIFARTTYPDFEVVVVDNQSSDRATLEYLCNLEARERVRVLRYDAPFNFSAINNWAANQCSGQVLGLVNNDIEVISPDWLDEMAGLAMRPQTGAVGAMLYYPDGTIQHAGMVLGLFGVAGHVHAGKPRGWRGYHDRARLVQNVSAVTGACLVVRRELFEAVSGLDENLPVEFNDIDFCLRVRQRGYRNVWTPFAELRHHESASRRVGSDAARRIRTSEVAIMLDRWGSILANDPAYNPNLSLQGRDFQLAFPPRPSYCRP